MPELHLISLKSFEKSIYGDRVTGFVQLDRCKFQCFQYQTVCMFTNLNIHWLLVKIEN